MVVWPDGYQDLIKITISRSGFLNSISLVRRMGHKPNPRLVALQSLTAKSPLTCYESTDVDVCIRWHHVL